MRVLSSFFKCPRSAAPRLAGAVFLGVLAVLAWYVPALWAVGEEAGDPLRILRVQLSPERLARELERADRGTLVKMRRADFEERVRTAARAAEARQATPRLLEATYRAILTDNALTGGTLEWKVLNPGPAKAVWPVRPLNLALGQPRFENGEALIAEFDGRGPGLLLAQPGQRSVFAAWSARGETRPEGIYFALELPTCPVAQLELDLPPGQVVTALNETALVTGPHPAEPNDNRRRWKVACGGRPQLNLLVRHTEGASPALVVVRRQRTTQDLTPAGVEAVFELDLSVLHQPARQLLCEVDSLLRPYEVSLRNHEVPWEIQPPAGAGQPAVLAIDPREPLWEGTLVVRCLAPLEGAAAPSRPGTPAEPPAITWTSPSLRVARGVRQGESLTLRFHPDLRAEGWQPGGFHLKEAVVEADQTQRLVLEGGGIEPEGAPQGTPSRRPTAQVRPRAVTYRAHQVAWWQLDAPRQTLTLQIAYEVSQGKLFQLPVLLPAEWDVERVEMSPASRLRSWGLRAPVPPAGRATLVVDLARPLTSPDERPAGPVPLRSRLPTLTVRLTPSRPASLTGRPLPFPDAEPLGARFREGALAVEVDEQVVTPVFQSSLPESDPEEDALWGKRAPDLYFPYRGQPPQGSLLLRPRAAAVRARCSSDVYLASGRAAVESRLQLEAEVGSPDHVLLRVSAGGGKEWKWQVEQGNNTVRAVERLHETEAGVIAVLAAATPVQAAGLAAARPRGELWRVSFTQPLRIKEPAAGLVQGTRAVQNDRLLDPQRLEVPLPAVVGAERMEGDVAVHLAGGEFVQVETQGFREGPALGGPARARAAAWRTFRYGLDAVALTLRGQGLTADRSAEAVIDRAELTTFVGRDGLLRHYYAFEASSWPQRTLPLRMPAGTRPVSARVDGRWVVPLPLVESPNGAGAQVELPVPERPLGSGEGPRRFEVAYTSEVPWLLSARVEDPAPEPPVPPVTFRRTWRLPPGVSPLWESKYRRLPGPGEGFEPRSPGRWPSDLFRLFGQLPGARPQGEAGAARPAALADALRALSGQRGGQAMALRDLLDALAHPAGRPSLPLLVDAVALEAARVGPDTAVAIPPGQPTVEPPPWDSFGLTVLHSPGVALLTTRRQADLWAAAPRPGRPFSEAVEAALAEARVNGRDPTGRFRVPAEWLEAESAGWPGSRPPAVPADQALTDWTEWEPVAGTGAEGELRVIAGETAGAAGLVVTAVLILALGWLPPRLTRRRLAFLLLWLGAAGVSLIWLPAALEPLAWWPLAAGCALGLAWYLRAAARRPPVRRRARSTAPGVAAVALALLATAGWGFQGTEPKTSFTVFLIPGSGDASDEQAVLVPRELLDRLQAQSQPAAPTAGAVLVAATYEGKLDGGEAQFHATFLAHCLGDGPATLALPLDGEGLRLVGEALLDGARVPIVPLAPPQAGYSLPVKVDGPHTVELSFRVPVTGPPEDRQAQFLPPRLVQSHLKKFTAPPGADHLTVTGRHGSQVVKRDGGGATLEAALGRLTGPLSLRWHEQAAPAAAAKVQFREAYLWDLGVGASHLTGLVEFRIDQGAATPLFVDLPLGLEVRGAEARRVGPGPAVRLRDWKVSGAPGRRAVQLDFPAPVSGVVQVTLDLVPAGPLPAQLTLPLPSPRGQPSPQGGFLAYRTAGLLAQRTSLLRVTGISAADFAPFWPADARPDPRTLAYACTIRREPGTTPVLQLRLQQAPPSVQAVCDLAYRVGPRQADLQAAIELSAPGEDLALIDLELQSAAPLTVTAVAGAGVRRWHQVDGRVLVWLERTVSRVKLDLAGWLPVAAGRFDMPCVRVPAAQAPFSRVRVLTTAGLTLSPVNLKGLLPLPDARPYAGDRAYLASQADYDGSFTVRSGGSAAAGRVLSFAEMRDRQFVFTAVADLRLPRGEARTVHLRLRNWLGEDVRLEAPPAARQREQRRGLGDRTWTLELPPGAGEALRLSLAGTVPAEAVAGGAPMPDVSVTGIDQVERWVAVGGLDMAIGVPGGLTPVTDPRATLAGWEGQAERVRKTGGVAWKVRDADWRLQLLPHAPAAQAGPAEVLLVDHAAAALDGRRWVHEALIWLRHDPGTDLTVTLPAPAQVLALTVDGADVAALQPDPRRLWLSLPGQLGVRWVRVRWRCLAGEETLEKPLLQPPVLEGARPGPVVWTVAIPSGWVPVSAGTGPRLTHGPAQAARVELERAAAQLQVLRALAASGRAAPAGAMTEAQRRFLFTCRLADGWLDRGGRAAEGERGPAGQTLREWHQELLSQGQELARASGLEEASAEIDRKGRVPGPLLSPDLDAEGTPVYATAADDHLSPQTRLAPANPPRDEATLNASAQWLGLLAAVWVLSFFPSLLAWARHLWPEQIAALGAFGWYLAGPTPLALGLLALAALGRLTLFIRGAFGWLRRSASPVSASGARAAPGKAI